MRPLFLGDETKATVAKLVDYAKKNPLSWADVQSIATGALPVPGQNPDFSCFIPVGFRCVFNYEYQRGILCRHLSVSVDQGIIEPAETREISYPNERAVDALAKLFGFTDGLRGDNVTIWVEKAAGAVNVMEAYVTI